MAIGIVDLRMIKLWFFPSFSACLPEGISPNQPSSPSNNCVNLAIVKVGIPDSGGFHVIEVPSGKLT